MRTDMRQKITIQSRATTQNGYGESSDTWVTFLADVWASKEQLLGNEYYTAESTKSKVEVKFRTHFFAGVQNEMRIVHGSETYDILSAINPKTLNRELLMYCRRAEQ